MRYFLIQTCVVFFYVSAFSQTGVLNEANSLYNRLAFYEASEIYVDLIGSAFDDTQMKRKLANCFYQIGDAENTERYYSKIIESDDITSMFINMPNVLRKTGNMN